MDTLREQQPIIGIRKAYFALLFQGETLCVGRDRFEQYVQEQGYLLARKRGFKPETTKSGNRYFSNKVANLQVRALNQVWLSDSTYWYLQGRWVYLTTLMDVYSRRLLALVGSENLVAESTVIPVLKQGLLVRNTDIVSGCILHSDRGGQYIDGNFLEILESRQMISSMCSSVYENPHIERLNSTIKHCFFEHWQIESYADFMAAIPRFMKVYNEHRLHDGLLPGRHCPNSFEAYLETLTADQRPILTLPPIVNNY